MNEPDVHVYVRVGAERYALPVANVLEVDRLGELAPVPGAGGSSLGVRSHHGQVLSVFVLASIFGIVRDGTPPWGLDQAEKIDFSKIRGIALTLPEGQGWESVNAFAV